MEKEIPPTGIRSLCSEGTTNLSFVHNPEERSVNLTNASVNIDNSRDVIIGNAIHHYHAPVTIVTTRPNGVIPEDQDEDNTLQLNEEEVERNDVFQPVFKKKKFNLFNIAIVSSVILLVIISILYFCIQSSEEVFKPEPPVTNHHEEIHPDYPGKPSHSFGSKTNLGPCKIIEEEDWGIKRNLDDIELIHPIPLVIVSHSVTPFCENYVKCSERVAQMQEYHISQGSPDIGYNFIIGGDGNLYVGRGWKARNFHWGNHSIGLNFVGNYFRDELTPKMIECAKNLLKYGEDNRIFTDNYIVVCHNQTSIRGGTNSPGPNVCGEIKTWPHYFGGKLDWNFLYGV